MEDVGRRNRGGAFNDIQARYTVEIARVAGVDCVTKLQRASSDDEISQWWNDGAVTFSW